MQMVNEKKQKLKKYKKKKDEPYVLELDRDADS